MNKQYSSLLYTSLKTEHLIVHGQCVFICNHIKKHKNMKIYFYDKSNTNGLKVVITNSDVLVYNIKNNDCYSDINNTRGFTQSHGAFYWISLDSQNQTIYVGIGEARLETVIYKYVLDFNNQDDYENNKLFLESLIKVKYNQSVVQKLRLLKNPIVNNVPLIVKNTEELTMEDIASNKYLPKAHLNIISQQLYDCISGSKFVLNDDDFPEFTEAIEYSIKTEGCWCYNKLKEKSTEFNKDEPNINETYLRITLGRNSGESPGIPYVMEIWPVGHYSPIHSHADANAIIRVLHGSINVKLYPYLCNDKIGVNNFAETNFFLNDITWISPTLNQIHQLKNLETNSDTCITIQCYMYRNNKIKHYDYFDYIDSDGNKQQYEPDSDMDFIKFKLKMREEWMNKNK